MLQIHRIKIQRRNIKRNSIMINDSVLNKVNNVIKKVEIKIFREKNTRIQVMMMIIIIMIIEIIIVLNIEAAININKRAGSTMMIAEGADKEKGIIVPENLTTTLHLTKD